MKLPFFYCLLLSFFCLFQSSMAAENVLEMPSKNAGIGLFPYSEVFEDPNSELTIDDLLSGNHTFLSHADGSLSSENFRRGLTLSTFWLKVNMVNHTKETDWFINVWGGIHKRVRAYIRSGDEATYTELTQLEKFRGTTFRFESAPNVQHTLYLKIHDFQTPLELKPELSPINSMLTNIKGKFPLFSAVFGSLFVLAIYNLFYYFYLRDPGFLALAFFITSFAITLGSFIGVWNYFSFTRNYLHYLGTSFGFSTIASLSYVFMSLLELKEQQPWGYRFFRFAFWANIALALLAPLLYFGSAIVGAVGLLLIPVAVAIIIRLYLQKYKFPRSIILSSGFFFLSMTPTLLMAIGVINTYGPLVDITPLALLIALVLISLTQAEKVRNKTEQAERTIASNQAKDEFLTTMSHELRTPMNAVVGAGRLLKMTKLSTDQSELVSRLNYSSVHMLSLINDILDLARTEQHMMTLEQKPFSLKEVVEVLNKLLRESADSKDILFSIKNHFTPFRQELVGDQTRLKQVLLNLLNNAIKFTEKGHVTLVITPLEIKPDNARLYFEISDSGIGIAMDKLDSLFQPFTQAESSTSRHYGGSGLGLAISHKLIQCMGGELKVESKPNMGSRFFFTIDIPLQAYSDKNHTKVSQPLLAAEEPLNEFKVLLVDDDEMNRFFGEKLLQACGVTGIVAESGEQAIEFLQHRKFDLVLLDISMPGMNGYETAQVIRSMETLSGVTIVALTAHAIEGERERCLAAGMDDFLAKPFELSDLKDLLHRYSQQAQNRKSGLER